MNNGRTYLRDGRAPIPTRESTSRIMSANKAKNTKPELQLRKSLREMGITGYRLNWKKAPGKPDIAFPGRKLAIFVHGCFWHRCQSCNPNSPKSNTSFWQNKFNKNIERDATKIMQLQSQGWSVIIAWECEIENDPKNVVNNIKNHIFHV